MPKNQISLSTDYRNETIERLKEELESLRYSLLHLLPWEMFTLLTSYHKCKSRKDTYQWFNNVVQQIIDSVPAQAEDRINSWMQERAKCPLCNRRPDSSYHDLEFRSVGDSWVNETAGRWWRNHKITMNVFCGVFLVFLNTREF